MKAGVTNQFSKANNLYGNNLKEEIIMLTSADYLLMEIIKKLQPISAEQLSNKYSSKIESINIRLNSLKSDYGYIDFQYAEKEFAYGLKPMAPTDKYIITDLGLKALQDHKTITREENHKLWLQSCWIPIIVSIVINEFYRLLPYIRYWLKLILKQLSL